MSAHGTAGPWSGRRGFDSLVQTATGINVSKAEHFGADEHEAARAHPFQALYHASGYFFAAGILAALYKQKTEGGSWEVDVSLAGMGAYLRSSGQYPGKTGFEARDYISPADVDDAFLEKAQSGFGSICFVRHSGVVEGVEGGWSVMSKPLGSDERRWL
ncbi:CoA-transferase family III-domain-containing protein [Aspergillus filifer]